MNNKERNCLLEAIEKLFDLILEQPDFELREEVSILIDMVKEKIKKDDLKKEIKRKQELKVLKKLEELNEFEDSEGYKLSSCYYCGILTTGVDHIIPQVILKAYKSLRDEPVYNQLVSHRKLTVACCHECNCLLSASLQNTL